MNWTDYTDDGYQIHPGEKQGSGRYPQFTRKLRKPSVAHDHDWRQVLGVAGKGTDDTGLGLMLDWSFDGESCLGKLVIKCN